MSQIIGINRRHYPAQASAVGKRPMVLSPDDAGSDLEVFDITDDPPPTVVVLVAGDIGDYAAYCGHGDPDWVMRHGDKISFEEACVHFPGGQLKRELYRG